MAEIVWIRFRGVKMSRQRTAIAGDDHAAEEDGRVVGLAGELGEADAQAGDDQNEDRPDDDQEHGTGTSPTIRDAARSRADREGRRDRKDGRAASSRSFLERQLRHEPVIELGQALDDDLGLAEDGHEVGIAVPARDDVPVEMAGSPAPADLPRFRPIL